MKIKKFVNENLFKMKEISLLPEEVHIWCIRWDELTTFIMKHWDVMSELEKKKINGFKFYEDRMRCASGKVLTRLLLSRYLDLENTKIEICHGKYGKPYLKQIEKESAIQFNVSHSGSVVVLAFVNFNNIGIDVEQIDPFFEYEDIVRSFFSKEEIEYVQRKKSSEAFYQLWTAKEAYLKAIGKGLIEEMPSFLISNNCMVKEGEVQKDCYIEPITIDKGYTACIALQK